MSHTRTVIAVFVIALLAAPGCSKSKGVSGDAKSDGKTGHGVAADAQPEHKSGHGAVAQAQQEHKSRHGDSGHAQPEHKTGHGDSGHAQPEERKTGTAVGEIKSTKNSPDGKNTSIEVLQPGEEKPRSYYVVYDPARNGPNPTVLAAVRAAGVGDRVSFDWMQTGHGPAITKFEVVKKAAK
jgi:hypothetical protein